MLKNICFFTFCILGVIYPICGYSEDIKTTQIEIQSFSDPHFSIGQNNSTEEVELNRIMRLYGMYSEGENLKNYCEFGNKELRYADLWSEDDVLRSVGGTLQYLIIFHAMRSIVSETKNLDYDQTKYDTLISNLVSQCSQNLSIVSKKLLIDNFKVLFSNFTPSANSQNRFIQMDIDQVVLKEQIYKSNLFYSSELFRSACTWGGQVDNWRYLTPFLKHPYIVSEVIRNLSKKKITYSRSAAQVRSEEANEVEVTNVLCRNFLCRKVNTQEYSLKFPKSLGFISVENDLKSLYCKKMQSISYDRNHETDVEIKKNINHRTFEDDNVLITHLISLLTEIPNFLIYSDKLSDLNQVLKTELRNYWTEWSNKNLAKTNQALPYEEPLIIERRPRSLYIDPFKPNFAVVFDVSVGEFDRQLLDVGKIELNHILKLSKNLMGNLRNEFRSAYRDEARQKEIIQTLKVHLSPWIKELERKMIILPWDKDISELIAREILQQLFEYDGEYFKYSSHDMVSIPLTFKFGIFALKYLNYLKESNTPIQ